MKPILKILLLAGTFTTAFAASVMNVDSHSFPIDGGGQFNVRLSDNPSQTLLAYCIDFNNVSSAGNAYDVNVSTLSNLANTRYGTTAQSAFLFQQTPNGSAVGDVATRYTLAGWLITQYDLTAGQTNSLRNLGIQSAIWNFLNASGSAITDGDWQTWMNNAVANLVAAQSLAGNIRILTTTDVAPLTPTQRYLVGGQEMITLDALLAPPGNLEASPEPSTLGMLSLGLLALSWRRYKQR